MFLHKSELSLLNTKKLSSITSISAFFTQIFQHINIRLTFKIAAKSKGRQLFTKLILYMNLFLQGHNHFLVSSTWIFNAFLDTKN